MDEQAPPTTGDDIDRSDEQEIVLSVLFICSSSLSLIGSSVVIFKILRDWAQNKSMVAYDRIILGLSCCDIVASITWAIHRFLTPSEAGFVWAFGNPTTCQAQGFLTQFAFSAWWYNCILSYYFLLTTLSQARGKNFVRRCEPWMHLSVLFFPTTAIMGLRRGWYSLGIDSCLITDPNILWIVGGIPTLFIYLSLIINNIVIYLVVRKSLRSSGHGAGLSLAQQRLKREVTVLMFLYVGSFFVTVSPTFALQAVYYYGNAENTYPLEVLHAIVLPLQGFFNVFIYLRPRYTRFRAANPSKPMCFILHQTLFTSKTPRLYRRRVANHVTYGEDVVITDITLGEDRAMNPSQALFYPGRLPSLSDMSSNNIAEGDNEIVSDHLEESKEEN